MQRLSGPRIRKLLAALGQLLEGEGRGCSIVVVGGASLALQGLVVRTTLDVDVVARANHTEAGTEFVQPDPFPEFFTSAIATVARDFLLPEDWMNTVAARQWPAELPDFLFHELNWLNFGSLEVGLASRQTLIALKLHASVDQDVDSVHYADLVALGPSQDELIWARDIVLEQDVGPDFPELVDGVLSRVRHDTAAGR